MSDSKVYWYSAEMRFAEMRFAGYYQEYLFKSDHLYEVGDVIKKRYGSGAGVSLVITYPFGTACPEHILNRMKYESTWPPILSEI